MVYLCKKIGEYTAMADEYTAVAYEYTTVANIRTAVANGLPMLGEMKGAQGFGQKGM